MVDKNLKEARRHGAPDFPAGCYRIRFPYAGELEQLECHWHEEMELFRVRGGMARVQCGGSFEEAGPGDLVFFNSGELHAAQALSKTPLEYDAVVFSPEMLCGGGELIRRSYVTPVLEGRLAFRRIVRGENSREKALLAAFDQVMELLTCRPPAYELRVQSRLLELFAGLTEGSKRLSSPKEKEPAEGIKAAIEYIRRSYSQPISLGELAELSHMSEGHFCRLFKKYTLKTPVRYINALRLAAARELLLETDRKELDIALETGFGSLSYFIDSFKQSTGRTPAQYRKEARGLRG